jgi:hypothetical protein
VFSHIGKGAVLMDEFYKQERVITADGEPVGDAKVRKFYSPFKSGKGYNFKYKSAAIKTYLGIELPKCFTDNECGKMYRLSKKIYSNSNLLAKRVNDEIRPLTKDDITTIVGVHRTNFGKLWNKMLQNKILKPIKINGEEYYCFNPLYYNSTQYMPLYLFIAFQDELKEHLPEWVVKRYLDMQEEVKQESKAE